MTLPATHLRAPLLTLCLAALVAAAHAQQPPAQSPIQNPIQVQLPPLQQRTPENVLTLHAEARAVLLDVVVTDAHGHAVHGLSAADFQLREENELQTIASLEEHHAPSAAERAARTLPPLPPNTWSNARPERVTDAASVVILLDGLNTPTSAQMYVRQQLLSYFESMEPGTEVAVFELGTQLRLLQGFSSDPAVLRSAIKTRDKAEIPPLSGRGYSTQAIQMDILTAAMQSLGKFLSDRPGRKDLIWFTGRIPRTVYDSGNALGGQLRDGETFAFDYSKATESLVLGQVSVYPVDSRGLATDPAFSAANSRAPSRNSATSFGIRQFYDHSDLEAVAAATGGHAFFNTNGIKESVAEVVEIGQSFYTLSYYPTNKQWDGKYRRLKLSVGRTPGVPSSLELQYRPGYYAVAEAPRLRPNLPAPPPPTYNPPDPSGRTQLTHSVPTPDKLAFRDAMALGAVDPGQVRFQAHVELAAAVYKLPRNAPASPDNQLEPKYRDRPLRTAQVFLRIPPDGLKLTRGPNGLYSGEIEAAALILDDQGLLVDTAYQDISMNLTPKSYATAQSDGVEMLLKVAIPEKGSYFLRAGVHDPGTGKAGALEVSTTDIRLP